MVCGLNDGVRSCDSGMGQQAAYLLAKEGFRVFAGIYLDQSVQHYQDYNKEEKTSIVTVKIDVSSTESIAQAVKQTEQHIKEGQAKGDLHSKRGLVALINCAGVAFVGERRWR